MLVLAKTEQQLCNGMWCHKSVDHKYTKQVPGAIGVVPPAPTFWNAGSWFLAKLLADRLYQNKDTERYKFGSIEAY